jgi:hypothetical protein
MRGHVLHRQRLQHHTVGWELEGLEKDVLGTSLKRRIGCFLKKTGMAACEELSYDSIGVVTTVGNTVRHVIL